MSDIGQTRRILRLKERRGRYPNHRKISVLTSLQFKIVVIDYKSNPMTNKTRRSILQLGSAAVGGTLLALNTLKLASAETDSATIFHVFAFQWKPGTTDAQKERAKKDILAFQGEIPGLLQTHAGPNISPRGKGYTFGGIMQFKDEASLNAYVQHPAHQALLKWLVPLIDAIELDLRS